MHTNKISDINVEKNNKFESTVNFKRKIFENLSHIKGLTLAFLTALIYSFSNIFFKKVKYLTCTEQLSINFALRALAMMIVMLIKKHNFLGPKGTRCLLNVRGILGVLALFLFYSSLQFLHPSDATALCHPGIIVTAILSKIFFKEKLGLTHFLAFLFTITGVVLISKPTFLFSSLDNTSASNTTSHNSKLLLTNLSLVSNSEDDNYYKFIIGLVLALLSAIFFGSLQIIIKKLFTLNVPNSVNTIYVSYYGIPICLLTSVLIRLKIGIFYDKEIFNLIRDIVFSILSGLFCVMGQITLNYSLLYEGICFL
jgi:drug/metabolite transporter (DMT)-like permease